MSSNQNNSYASALLSLVCFWHKSCNHVIGLLDAQHEKQYFSLWFHVLNEGDLFL